MTSDSLLHRVRVVLFEPQDPVNIAATVRAMKNMGVRDLYLVRPVEITAYRIEGIAHDTYDVIERIRTVETLDEALADCVHVAAFSARRRRHRWALASPREMATALLERSEEGPVAVLFGREDHGLPNEALDRANTLVSIPTTEHASLNLAQAVLVALYELHLSAGDASRVVKGPRHDAPPATAESFERLFQDVERSLAAIEFFKTRYRDHIMRSVRSLYFRSAPDAREIELLRAMHIEVVRTMERIRREQPHGKEHEQQHEHAPEVKQGHTQDPEQGHRQASEPEQNDDQDHRQASVGDGMMTPAQNGDQGAVEDA
ncbi:MAG: RNA methyltransferase [Gemmatimonadaceae bacterium]|nr:RNA methyltransferase [Gemmatimonadaceae bacterium]